MLACWTRLQRSAKVIHNHGHASQTCFTCHKISQRKCDVRWCGECPKRIKTTEVLQARHLEAPITWLWLRQFYNFIDDVSRISTWFSLTQSGLIMMVTQKNCARMFGWEKFQPIIMWATKKKELQSTKCNFVRSLPSPEKKNKQKETKQCHYAVTHFAYWICHVGGSFEQ